MYLRTPEAQRLAGPPVTKPTVKPYEAPITNGGQYTISGAPSKNLQRRWNSVGAMAGKLLLTITQLPETRRRHWTISTSLREHISREGDPKATILPFRKLTDMLSGRLKGQATMCLQWLGHVNEVARLFCRHGCRKAGSPSLDVSSSFIEIR